MDIFKAVCVVTGLTYAYGMNSASMDIILRMHNDFRRNFANGLYGSFAANMRKLEWSVELQLQARRMLHCDQIITPTSDPHINVGSSEHGNVTHILRNWVLELHHYSPQYGTCVYLEECKRVLTMLHAQHRRIGCAYTNRCIVRNTNINLLVCKYEGSDETIVPFFKRGLPCTKCEDATSFCDRGLCVPCTGSAQQCDCRKSCHKPGIGVGSLDSTTCTCTCSYGMGPNCDEDCVNPHMYVDWDICSHLTQEDCETSNAEDRRIYREMCPARCACRRHPDARDHVTDTPTDVL